MWNVFSGLYSQFIYFRVFFAFKCLKLYKIVMRGGHNILDHPFNDGMFLISFSCVINAYIAPGKSELRNCVFVSSNIPNAISVTPAPVVLAVPQDNQSAWEANVTPQLRSWLLIYFQSEPSHQDAFLRVDIMGPRKHFFRLVYTEYICVNINAIWVQSFTYCISLNPSVWMECIWSLSLVPKSASRSLIQIIPSQFNTIFPLGVAG